MNTKPIGIILIVLGILMLLYNSFNFTTTEKVVDIGPIEINKEVNHPIAWSPIIGIVLAVGGVVLLVVSNKKNA
jgi:drug/metabolite transporter (DMT)-like permease